MRPLASFVLLTLNVVLLGGVRAQINGQGGDIVGTITQSALSLQCNADLTDNWDYPGWDLERLPGGNGLPATDVYDCCRRCQAMGGCLRFTFNKQTKGCILKGQTEAGGPRASGYSGIMRNPNQDPTPQVPEPIIPDVNLPTLDFSDPSNIPRLVPDGSGNPNNNIGRGPQVVNVDNPQDRNAKTDPMPTIEEILASNFGILNQPKSGNRRWGPFGKRPGNVAGSDDSDGPRDNNILFQGSEAGTLVDTNSLSVEDNNVWTANNDNNDPFSFLGPAA